MKKILLIIFILITAQVKAQEIESDKLFELLKEIHKSSVLKDTLKNNLLSINQPYFIFDRLIDFGYKHERIDFWVSGVGEIQLDILKKKDSIKIGTYSIKKWNSEKIKSTSLFIISDRFIDMYLIKHKELYNNKVSEKEFLKQLLKENVVGFGCGASLKEISYASRRVQRYIKYKQRKRLNKYLRSTSPELQFLGALGLMKIGKLNKDEKVVINHLIIKNSKINHCSGCLYDLFEPFSNLLKTYDFYIKTKN